MPGTPPRPRCLPVARPVVAALLLGVGVLSACGGTADRTVLRVFAAASLTGPFEELAADFEAEHPGVDVQLDLAGSTDLVARLREGAPADVLATADEATMRTAVDDRLTAGAPAAFASNRLTIAVPPGNPADVDGLADLGAPGLDLVVCAPEVPCGAAAQRVAEAAGVDLAPVSEERSVTDVLGKVTSGQADAGLVYVTDVRAASDAVEEVPLPRADRAVVTSSIVVAADADQPALAQEFVDLVVGPDGRRTLRDAGFGAAP